MKGIIVYWSMTGNTESIAERIAADTGFDLVKVADANVDNTLGYEAIVLGCPAMGAEELEDSEFKPFYDDLISKMSDQKIFLFGSYGWGDGQWMRDWQADARNNGANLICDGLIVNEDISNLDEAAYEVFLNLLKD